MKHIYSGDDSNNKNVRVEISAERIRCLQEQLAQGKLTEDGFNDLVDYYFPYMYSSFHRYCSSKFDICSDDEVEDFYFEVLAKMWEKIRVGHKINSFVGYFRRSAFRKLIDYKRQKRKFQDIDKQFDIADTQSNEPLFRQMKADVLYFLKPLLDVTEHEIFAHYLNWHSYEEIICLVPTNENKVKNTISKAKTILRKNFELIDNQLVKKKAATLEDN